MRAALYARVSSDHQEHEETIQSQLGELRARVQEDGVITCQEFTDEPYSRDNLVRPGLDRLYVQCPDRLAAGAKMILLCTREDASVSSTGKRCPPGSFLVESVEEVVWGVIREALQQPEVLVEEYKRRLAQARTPDMVEAERKQVALALKRIKAQEDRITDAYINEAMELDRYKGEMENLRQRRKELERAAQDIERRGRQEIESRKAQEHLERSCRQVSQGLVSCQVIGMPYGGAGPMYRPAGGLGVSPR